MEPVGVYHKEDWESLNKMFSSNIDHQEVDFALQFLQCPSAGGGANANDDANNFGQETFFYSSQNFNTNFYLSQESTATSTTTASNFSVCFPTQSHENSHSLMNDNISDHLNPMMVNDNNISDDQSMNYYVMEGQMNALTQFFPINDDMQDVISLKEGRGKDSLANVDHNYTDHLSLKRKFEVPQQPDQTAEVHHPKKKSRVPRDLPKDKRSIVQPKKNQKLIKNDEDSNGGPNGQSCSSYCSEDESNASQELNGGASSDSKASAALNSSGKPRAGRGAATDPQSLYARKRRERINERLRILQTLVPNGTKVDISTMLEEAVHYVKFLQLQIKLLSSDDMWMFAPIAYNGMDMGLYQKINSQTQ